ncbi:MAG: HU family DNA-binding protein [Geminicoccales bacterium]
MARKPATKTTRGKRAKTIASSKRSKTTRASAAKRPTPTPSGGSDKDHLISVIQAGTGCGKGAAKQTLDRIVATITASLKKNQRVQLVGFGAFEVTRRPARKGRNPRTGEAIRVKASKGVRFKAGQTLKRSV